MKKKVPKEIRNELLESFFSLEKSYQELAKTTDTERKTSYLDLEMSEHLLNAIKALEYHFRDDVPDMRTKKRWNKELKAANRLLKKYGENSEKENEFSKLQLKIEFDDSGYLEKRRFFAAAADNRTVLKRKI